MDPSWTNFLQEELKKEYMIKLRAFVSEREKEVNVFPARKNLFRPFELCRYQMVKVVIIGGEPYPSYNADGLAFSVSQGSLPGALKNILEEVHIDYYKGNTGKVNTAQTGDLKQWADQGVLLLNSVLTTEQDGTSHKGKGWEIFIENLVTWLSSTHPHHIAFLLWGSQAYNFEKFIDKKKHLVLTAEHPATGSFKEAWFGCNHFTKANEFIKKHYWGQKSLIEWGTYKNYKFL